MFEQSIDEVFADGKNPKFGSAAFDDLFDRRPSDEDDRPRRRPQRRDKRN